MLTKQVSDKSSLENRFFFAETDTVHSYTPTQLHNIIIYKNFYIHVTVHRNRFLFK